jgi:hypothetical protein
VDSQLEEKKREMKRKRKERKGKEEKNTHPPPHTQRLRSNSMKKLRLKLMDQNREGKHPIPKSIYKKLCRCDETQY